MAQTDTTKKQEDTADSTEQQDSDQKKVQPPPHLRPINTPVSFNVGKYNIEVNKITNKVSPGKKVTISGYHLNFYDSVALITNKTGDSKFKPKEFRRAQNDSDVITFTVPDFNENLTDGDFVIVQINSRALPQASGIIFPYLKYSKKNPQDQEEEEQKKKAEEAKKKAESNQKTSNEGPTTLMMGATDDAITGIASAFFSKNDKEEKKDLKPERYPTKINKVKENYTLEEDEDFDNLDLEYDEDDDFVAVPESFESSAELIGEYLDKNPELVLDSAVRNEILTALSKKDISGLSQEAKSTLTRVFGSEISNNVSDEAKVQLLGAFEIVNNSVNEPVEVKSEATVNAQVSSGSNVNTPAESATVRVEASAQVSGTAKKDVSEVISQSQTANVSQSNSEAQTSAAQTTQAQTSSNKVSLRQSTDTVGELIYNSNDDIPNKAEIVSSLEKGQLPESAEARDSLQNFLLKLPNNKLSNSQQKAVLAIQEELKANSNKPAAPIFPAKGNEPNNSDAGKEAASVTDLSEDSKSSSATTSSVEPKLQTKAQTPKMALDKIQSRLSGKVSLSDVKIPSGASQILKNLQNKQEEFNKKNSGNNKIVGLGVSGELASAQPINNSNEVSQSQGPTGKAPRKRDESVDEEAADEPASIDSAGPAQAPRQEIPEKDDASGTDPEIPKPNQGDDLKKADEQADGVEDEENSDRSGGSDEKSDNPEAVDNDEEQKKDDSPDSSLAQPIQKTAEKTLDEIAEMVNLEVNSILIEAAYWIWGLGIETFGLSILIGAVLGDCLLLLKNWLVKRAITVLSLSSAATGINFDNYSKDEIAKKIKFSRAVKWNIAGMNLVILAIIFIIFLILLTFLRVLCSPTEIIKDLPSVTMFQDVCNTVNGTYDYLSTHQ